MTTSGPAPVPQQKPATPIGHQQTLSAATRVPATQGAPSAWSVPERADRQANGAGTADRRPSPQVTGRTDTTSVPPDRGVADAGAATTGQPGGRNDLFDAGRPTDGSSAGVPADAHRFITVERSASYTDRWRELKGDFVDDPRDAVRKVDALVGDVLDEIARVSAEQRSQLERGLDTDETTTEDLRQAMHRYRRFFERLLKI